VYFYAPGGSLDALSLKTGAQAWFYTCKTGSACPQSGVSVANGLLFASCGSQNLGDQCAFDAKTGALLRLYGTGGGATTNATPLVANGAVIGACGDYGGNLCKFAP
jgi:outer membrane protein assembly factor BamB